MQLEKEQEAVVNRLTRELTILRQQSASVASTTSSASVGYSDAVDQTSSHGLSGNNHPTTSRRHRSSSNLSIRSATTAATTATGGTGASGSTLGTTAGVAGSMMSGIAPARDTATPYSHTRDQLSRQSSVASRRSEASSPSLSSSLYQGDHFPNLLGHRHTGSASQPQTPSQSINLGSVRSSHIPATQRYEEVAHHRSELEMVKKENEALRRRIRELERSLVNRRGSASEGSRRESISTGTGMPQHPRATIEGEDDVVNIGESAGNTGIGVSR